MLTANRLEVCDIQGELFALASRKGLKSTTFIKVYMKSQVCQYVDEFDEDPRGYSHVPQSGPDIKLTKTAEDLLEEMNPDRMVKAESPEEIFPEDLMRWAGHLYRYWHYLDRCRPSNKIWRKANGTMMRKHYDELRDMKPEDAIEKLLDYSARELWGR